MRQPKITLQVMFVLVLLILVAGPLVGSNSLSYGVQGGIASSTMVSRDPDGSASRYLGPILGTVAGGYVEYPLWSNEQDDMNLAVRSGLQYALLGGDMGDALALHCVQIPLLVKLGFPLQMPGEAYLLAGFTGGFIVGATAPETGAVDMDNFNGVELLAQAGMGFGLSWGLSFDFRYQMGLTNRTAEGGDIPFNLYDTSVLFVASYKLR